MAARDVEALLEAARWAPSAGNSQPWAFHAVARGQRGWDDVVACLTGGSATWAPTASLLVVNLCHTHVEDTSWDYGEFAMYDLGQAVAHMTLQAQSMSLACRQFRAFDKEQLSLHLGVPKHWEVVTMTAIGRSASHVERPTTASGRVAAVAWPRVD